MNKLFTKIAALALGATMATGVGVAVASGTKVSSVEAAAYSGTFNKLTGSTIETGKKYLLSSTTYLCGNTISSNRLTNSSTSITSGASSVVNPDNSAVWTIGTRTVSGTDYYTFYNDAVSKYLLGNTSNARASLGSVNDTTACWSLTTSNNTFDFTVKGGTRRLRNNGTNGWASYATSTGSALTLYKEASTVHVTGVSVSPTAASIGVGGTQQLTPTISPADATDKDVTYSSSATSVATVSSTGLITGVAAGNATITVTTHDGGYTATCAVTVTAPVAVTGVSLNKNSTSLEVGGSETLTATVSPADASNKNVTWGTSDANIATVSNGEITAVGVGTATITVTTVDGGYTATCTVKVTAPSSVTFLAGTDVGTSSGQNEDTIVKDGISFYCSSIRNADAPYRLYSGSTVTFTSTIGNMAKIEFTGNDSSNKISNMGSETTGTLVTDATNNKATWTGDATTVSFTMTAQGRASQIVVTLASSDPLVELDASSATSVSMMKGNSDTSVKVHVVNITTKTWTFTYDEGGNTGLSTSSYINVSAGAAVNDVHTLTITTKAVGTTVLHISVSGTACATTIPVTVNQKPASMTVVHSDIHEGAIEIITGAYKQVSFSGKDTDGNDYAIAAADVTPAATSGASHVSLSGSRINGSSQGDAVVRYTLNALTSVYADLTVHVVDDYIESVDTPTYASNLTDTQGDSPTVSVFTSRPGTMHSGASTTVPFERYLFSYENSYASAEYGSVFSYDFSHGTTVDATHKLQTIYVFCDVGSTACGTYTITVEQLDDPLTAITFTNVVNHEVDITRGDSFQLEWAYTPTNPTDGKEVEFIIDDNDAGIGITVSSAGLLGISASSGLGTALVLIQSAHDDTIQDYVYVTAVLESMKYTVNEEESLTPSATVAVGDRVVMVAVDKNSVNYELTGFSGTSTDYGVATSYTTSVSKDLVLTVVAGNSSGTVAFKTSDNKYVAWVSGKNSITPKATLDDYGSWTIDGTTFQNKQDTNRYMYLNYNNGTPRFACYADKSSDTTGNYTVPTFLKITGGNVEYDVTEELFNAIYNNFGTGKTYEWSDSCPSFDAGAWADACEAIVDLADYDDYKLNRAVANASGNEIEVFLAKYDFLVLKFGINDYDYLERFQSGGINYGAKIVNPMNVISQNTNSIVIVVIVSMVSVTAIGGYFFLRKRREQN